MRFNFKPALLFLWLGLTQTGHAETLYGVDATQVLSVDSTTRVTTQLLNLSTWSPGGTAWNGQGNELAYDAFANSLMFSEASGSRIGRYNTSTSTASVLADLDSFSSVTSVVNGSSVDGKMGGGAFFYNDAYYFTVENFDGSANNHSRMFKASMNAGHTAFSSVSLVSFGGGNPWLGDFGDMAVNSSGIVYGSSTGSGSGVLNGFWSFNINNAGAGITSISTSTALAQLAFSADYSSLYATHFSSGDLGTIDTTTGVYTNNGSLSGASTGLTDMSGATSPVPEPSSAVLLIVGVMLVFRRRSNAVSRVNV